MYSSGNVVVKRLRHRGVWRWVCSVQEYDGIDHYRCTAWGEAATQPDAIRFATKHALEHRREHHDS